MNKDEWVWLSIRVFGIYLLILGITKIPSISSSVYILSSGLPVSDLVATMKKSAIAEAVENISQIFIFFISTFYFIKHGKLLHSIATKEIT